MAEKFENSIQNRYEFVMLYDVENGNPNGDPDAGNMPRIDPETGKGIVTDVCIKRKIRDYVDITHSEDNGFDIYIKQDGILLNKKDEEVFKKITDEDKAKKSLNFRSQMCEKYFDIRAFGAVMTTAAKDKTISITAGQVRGPVQLAFGQSIDPIVPRQITITRVSITTKKDEDKDNTMGNKFIVPYALYRQEGFVSANLAHRITGFDDKDLELLWEAITNMFEFDRSAARGKMSLRKLIIFKHNDILGNAHADDLFKLIKIERKDMSVPARAFEDYSVKIGVAPENVTIIEK
ncbi:type I-C CRISPR-associated protein Cas7/Csd2 [Clostridia bacterium]|nr:type I-C CRISPR-associated protein Cas7/Csd2 [Clostridia bacterium]